MFIRRKAIATQSDEELVIRLKGGHQPSLAALWDRYAHLLFGVCMKYLQDTEKAKDAVVELFGTLPELLAKHDVKSFRPWIHTVARNRCLMLLRKRDPSKAVDENADLADGDDVDEAVLHEATLQRLEEAIDRLNEGQRTCIRLFYLQRQCYQQIAAVTGLPVDQVRSHLQNGRRNLRLMLQDHVDQQRT